MISLMLDRAREGCWIWIWVSWFSFLSLSFFFLFLHLSKILKVEIESRQTTSGKSSIKQGKTKSCDPPFQAKSSSIKVKFNHLLLRSLSPILSSFFPSSKYPNRYLRLNPSSDPTEKPKFSQVILCDRPIVRSSLLSPPVKFHLLPFDSSSSFLLSL